MLFITSYGENKTPNMKASFSKMQKKRQIAAKEGELDPVF